MHVNWKHVAGFLAVLPFLVVFGAWIGFFNVGASSGHWKITDWFLHFAMRSAVRTYALAVEVPDELPQAGLEAAAGHYARGCALCHSAPGEARSAAVSVMLPAPPDLVETLSTDKWTDAELFRIVKHGVRFTGMPAWPSQDRDDEVWAMVVFLRSLPGLDAAGYRALAYGAGASPPTMAEPDSLEDTIADCVRCHGADGLGRGDAVPVIAGQNPAYLAESLKAYGTGTRASGIMQLAASQADPALFEALASHFAGLPASGQVDPPVDSRLVESGRALFQSGIAERQVPACANCHDRPGANPVFPSIKGQKEYYVREQLRLFAEGLRGGTGYREIMHQAARLEPAEMDALAAYLSQERRP